MYSKRNIVIGNTIMALTYFEEKRVQRLMEVFGFIYKDQFPEFNEYFNKYLEKLEDNPELIVDAIIEKNKAEIKDIQEQIKEIEKDPDIYERIYE